MDELTSYKRVWMWQKRHTPEALATNEHRKVFKIHLQSWNQGKCPQCGILRSEAPSHNCLQVELDSEAAMEFITKFLLSTN